MMLTQQDIKEVLEYKNGALYWSKPRAGVTVGKRAGRVVQGYRQISVNGKRYYEHRLVFMLFNNWVPDIIDHIDGNPSNNRIDNLRPCSTSQNGANMKMRKSNKSGIKNVSWDKDQNKWKVQIMINGRKKSIGRYEDLELAELVAFMAREKYQGEFANHE